GTPLWVYTAGWLTALAGIFIAVIVTGRRKKPTAQIPPKNRIQRIFLGLRDWSLRVGPAVSVLTFLVLTAAFKRLSLHFAPRWSEFGNALIAAQAKSLPVFKWLGAAGVYAYQGMWSLTWLSIYTLTIHWMARWLGGKGSWKTFWCVSL